MPLLANPPLCHDLGDQARELRALVARRAERTSSSEIRCRTLAIASGKGGVGKSVIALNLAVALSRRGDSVCLLDAGRSAGQLELLCGQSGYWNLSHVVAGSRHLGDILLSGPSGVRILPGAECLVHDASPNANIADQLIELERNHDWLIVDTSSGQAELASPFVRQADCVMIVTTPEPTAIAETYVALKTMAAVDDRSVMVLVNQAESAEQAVEIQRRLRQTTRTFLRTVFDQVGFVPNDRTVRDSVFSRRCLVETSDKGPAWQAIEQLAEQVRLSTQSDAQTEYFRRLMTVRNET